MYKYFFIICLTLFISNSNCSKHDRVQFCEKSLTTVSGTKAPSEVCSGQLIFEDNFNELDFKTWKHENTLSGGGGNWEFQWYTNNRSNSYVRDSKLILKPTLTAESIGEQTLSSGTLNLHGGDTPGYCTDFRTYGCERTGTPDNILNPIKSAKISTMDSFSFKYGKIEVRAKMPAGDWLWPAIWMLPRYNEYSTWPASGEIDIVESRGNKQLTINGKNIGVEQVGQTLHWGPNYEYNRFERTHFEKNTPEWTFDKDFRVYGLEWTPDYLKFSVDGYEAGTVWPQTTMWEFGQFPSFFNNPWKYGTKLAPFDQEFYLILNLAVGGTNYFPDIAVNPVKKPWSNTSPTAARDFWNGRGGWLPTWNLDRNNGEDAALQVDYIKVWAL